MADMLDGVLQALRAELRAVAPADALESALRRVEDQARAAHGGCRPRVMMLSPDRQGRLERALARGVPLHEAFAEAGVSRATGFRMLKRRPAR